MVSCKVDIVWFDWIKLTRYFQLTLEPQGRLSLIAPFIHAITRSHALSSAKFLVISMSYFSYKTFYESKLFFISIFFLQVVSIRYGWMVWYCTWNFYTANINSDRLQTNVLNDPIGWLCSNVCKQFLFTLAVLKYIAKLRFYN